MMTEEESIKYFQSEIDIIQSEPESESLAKKVKNLSKAYNDLSERIWFNENRVNLVEDKIRSDEILATNAVVPYSSSYPLVSQVDQNKLPRRISDKNFPVYSLPIMKVAIKLRDAFSYIKDLFLPRDISFEHTGQMFRRAQRERNILNIMKVQRMINKFQKAMQKAIQNNQDCFCEEIEYETTDNMVIANAVGDYFKALGMDYQLSISNYHIFLLINIPYNYSTTV